ncbi:uncharacterized protein [Miscanthus floridulus]|uniref:uncharacterized protein n=1 Tax=Miscanthus floridulus TaxID=154761 RepID=UPI003458A419
MAPSSSSSSGGSHAGLAIAATAMALSGTLVLYSLCRAKQPHLVPSDSDAPSPRLRPCLSSSEKRKKKKREMARRGSQQKRVRFADDVVDNKDNGAATAAAAPAMREEAEAEPSCAAALRTPMPANREALYRGMLRGRTMLRVACSY